MSAARKAAIARAFGGAGGYDEHARVQRQVALRLAERVASLPLADRPRILEIGCGTGFLTRALMDRLPGAEWWISDLSAAMVARCRTTAGTGPGRRYFAMDGERPCLDGRARFDLIVSSFAAQWFEDLPGAIARLRAMLAPGGRLAIATLASGSLAEWRRAYRRHGGSEGAAYPPPRRFAALGALDVTHETVVERHADARAFLRALRGIGAGTPGAGGRPLPPGGLRAAMRCFEAGGATASYEIAYCLFGPGN